MSDFVEKEPWTVMIKYLKKDLIFFLTEVVADSEEEAISVTKELGYPLSLGLFTIIAKQVPLLPTKNEINEHAHPNEPNSHREISVGIKIRATATRK